MTRLERILALKGLEFATYSIYADNYAELSSLNYGDLKNFIIPGDNLLKDISNLFLFVPQASGSDYSGSLLEKSNYEVFLGDFGSNDFIYPCYGGYDTYAIAVELKGLLYCDEETFDSIINTIKNLDTYPVLDEDHYSNLQLEVEDEAWDNWVYSDLKRAIERKFPDIDLHFNDGELFELFIKKMEETNTYWEEQGNNMWVDINRIVEAITIFDLMEFYE